MIAIVSGVYLAMIATRTWIPHDEGTLAHAAERVLAGELPHRDFDAVYTGGLEYLHALGFKLLGTKLTSIRIVLLVFAVPFIMVTYFIAARVLRPLPAAAVAVVCLAWSLPNYFAGLPSWYNLFFAAAATLALLRHLDCERSRKRALWLVLAGLACALSLLTKVTAGAFCVAAVLLHLLYLEGLECDETTDPDAAGGRSLIYAVFLTVGLAAFAGALAMLVSGHVHFMEVLHFVVPGVVLAVFVAGTEWARRGGASVARFRRLAALAMPFGLGLAVPVGFFLLPYVSGGALDDLARGLFVLPRRRLESATWGLPAAQSALAALPYAILIFVPLWRRLPWPTVIAGVVGLGLLGCLVGGRSESMYTTVWSSVRPLVPIVVVAACVLLVRDRASAVLPRSRRAAILLLAAMVAMVSMVQYPYAFGVYFLYTAPFVVLAIAEVVAGQTRAPRLVHLVVACFYAGYALVHVNTGHVRMMGVKHIQVEQEGRLDRIRGGLLVGGNLDLLYGKLATAVRAFAAPGDFIYAAPDCPEVYFLTATRNPTRTLYDIFDEPEGRVERILAALDEHDVRVVVINREGWEVSGAMDPALAAALAQRYPRAAFRDDELGWFLIRSRP